MAQFDRQIVVAKTLIERFGEDSTHRRKVDGTPGDAAKPWLPGTPTYTDTTVSAVWLDYEISRVDGTMIQRGDQRVLVAASDVTAGMDPSTDQIVRASGEVWTVKRVNLLNPNGQEILYDLQVRR